MQLKPLSNRIIVSKAEEEKKTAGGIIIPETHSEKPSLGTVISIGKDIEELKENDIVYFGKYSGTEIKLGNESFLVLEEKDVLAILKS